MPITKELISDILYFEDLEGLIKMGAPRDEYDSEAKMIFDFLLKSGDKNEDSLARHIALTFNIMFHFKRNIWTKDSVKIKKVSEKILEVA